MVGQRLEKFIQVAVKGGLHLQAVDRIADPMVGDPGLREIVSADAFAAVARADQGTALIGTLLVDLLLVKSPA